MKERLQKLIARSGLLSRRAAETAILQGRVKVNGQTVQEMGVKADPEVDRIEVDEQLLQLDTSFVTVLLNKPRKVLTTKKDPEGRKTVMDLLSKDLSYLNPVGRLDYDSDGLLLLSNEGSLAHQLTHPSFEVAKTYEVKVHQKTHPKPIELLTQGILLEDGEGRFESLEIIESKGDKILYRVTVREGRNRFIRRMFDAVGLNVMRLRRVQFGPIRLDDLESGKFRHLSESEVTQLRELVKA